MFKIANRFSNKFKKGFTLLELTVVLTIMSIVLALGISSVGKVLQSKGDSLSEEHMDKVRTALERYKVSNGRYPCPAPLNVAVSDANFGKEALLTIGTPADGNVCYRSPSSTYNNAQTLGSEGFVRVFDAGATTDAQRWNRSVIIGAIPVQELGIDKKYATDKWGNKLVYAVTEKLAADTSNTTPSRSDDDASTSLPVLGATTGGADRLGAIIIRDTAGVQVAPNADYVVISNGADGNGAFNANATTQSACVTTSGAIGILEQENCNFTNNIFTASGTYNKSENANYFFDLVRWDSFTSSDVNITGSTSIKNNLTIDGSSLASSQNALVVKSGGAKVEDGSGTSLVTVDNTATAISNPLNSTQGATFSGGTTGTNVNNALNANNGATFGTTGSLNTTTINDALNVTGTATFSGGTVDFNTITLLPTGGTCTAVNAGAIRYNSSGSGSIEFCNGATWVMSSPWPAGDYCIIQKQNTSCPAGFFSVDPGERLNGVDGALNGAFVIGGSTSANSNVTFRGAKPGSGRDFTKSVKRWAWCCKTTSGGEADAIATPDTSSPFESTTPGHISCEWTAWFTGGENGMNGTKEKLCPSPKYVAGIEHGNDLGPLGFNEDDEAFRLYCCQPW